MRRGGAPKFAGGGRGLWWPAPVHVAKRKVTSKTPQKKRKVTGVKFPTAKHRTIKKTSFLQKVKKLKSQTYRENWESQALCEKSKNQALVDFSNF